MRGKDGRRKGGGGGGKQGSKEGRGEEMDRICLKSEEKSMISDQWDYC